MGAGLAACRSTAPSCQCGMAYNFVNKLEKSANCNFCTPLPTTTKAATCGLGGLHDVVGVGAECRLAHLILQVFGGMLLPSRIIKMEGRRNMKFFLLSGNLRGLQNVPAGALAAACQGLS